MRIRMKTYVALLGFVVAAGAVTSWDTKRLTTELLATSTPEWRELAAAVASVDGGAPRMAREATVSRRHVLFGAAEGKVTIHVESPRLDGLPPRFDSFEYRYARHRASWELVESGRCSSPECSLRARELLKRAQTFDISP